MGNKLQEPTWYYDELVETQTRLLARAVKTRQEARVLLENHRRLVNRNRNPLSRETMEETKRLFQQAVKNEVVQSEFLKVIGDAKPFIIGPATADSLALQKPDNYDYIRNGQLPFPNIFFNFFEPLTFTLPVLSSGPALSLRGIHMCKGECMEKVLTHFGTKNPTPGVNVEDYLLKYYFEEGDRLNVGLSKDLKRDAIMTFHYRDSVGEGIDAEVHPAEGIMYLNLPDDVKRSRQEMLENKFDRGKLYAHTKKLSSDIADEFFNVPNLAINLINYINAHNIHVRKVDGKTKRKTPTSTGNLVNTLLQRPFYLIEVRDEEHVQYADQQKTWDLKWRVYVRGHDRRFRDDQGFIESVTWIVPHIKGPPTAPWREARYQVLFEKLQRERAFLSQFGIN